MSMVCATELEEGSMKSTETGTALERVETVHEADPTRPSRSAAMRDTARIEGARVGVTEAVRVEDGV